MELLKDLKLYRDQSKIRAIHFQYKTCSKHLPGQFIHRVVDNNTNHHVYYRYKLYSKIYTTCIVLWDITTVHSTVVIVWWFMFPYLNLYMYMYLSSLGHVSTSGELACGWSIATASPAASSSANKEIWN